MTGLQKLCKAYGGMKVTRANGEKVVWVWDYAKDMPRLETDMSKEEKASSEKAKWMSINIEKEVDNIRNG